MRKRPFFLLFILCFLLLGFFTFFGDKGILHLLKLKKELARIKEVNLKMEEENQKLREEIWRLKQDKRYLEEIARKELGMVKAGELLYQFDFQGLKEEHPK